MQSRNPEPLNILLVDDQPAKLLSYEAVLTGLGENILKAPSATKALECLLHTDVAVVLVDVCMPDLDGFELATMIREHPRFKKTAIIFVSAIQVTDMDHLRGYEHGAVDYIPVPVVPEILRAKVSVFLELHRKTRELERLNRELERRVTERTAELEGSMKRLHESEERLTLAIEGAGMATWDADPRTGRAIWSQNLFAMLGYPPSPTGEATLDMRLRPVHPEDQGRSLEALDRAEREGSHYLDEHRIVRDDGGIAWLSSFGRFHYDKAGEAVRFVGVTTDVTARRRLEDELRAADRRKDEFLATLSHELRNPLAPILAATQLLRLEQLPQARRANARQVIERQVAQLVRLVDDLLDVSRITSNKIVLQREPVLLSTVIARAVETCAPLLDARHIELTVDAPDTGIEIMADLPRLVQVVGNLLNNAAKYTDPGGRVRIAAERDGAEVVLRVVDNGVGIAPETLPTVFDLFTQASRTERLGQGGLGIGLALVRRLVAKHGGSVAASSEGVGRGSEFVVRLPVLSAGAAARPTGAAAADRLPASVRHRILIADDNEDAAASLAELCESFGHTVRVAHDGLDALDLAATFLPKVVLLDIGMPLLDGYDAARRIRREPWGKGMVLIAQTGWGQAEDRRRAQTAGFDRHLTKPVSVEQLTRILSEISGVAPPRSGEA